MKNLLLIVSLVICTAPAFAEELPQCGDKGPNVRYSKSELQQVEGSDSYVTIAGDLGRQLFSAMTTAPKDSCNSGYGASYTTTCNTRGTTMFSCQQIVFKDFGCADYKCSVIVSDLPNGKL